MHLVSIISALCILANSVLSDDELNRLLKLHAEQEDTERKYRALIEYCRVVFRAMGEDGQEVDWRNELKDLKKGMENLRKEFNEKTQGKYIDAEFLKQETQKLEYGSNLQKIKDITATSLTYYLTAVQGSGDKVAQCSSSESYGDLPMFNKEVAQFKQKKEKEAGIVSDIKKAIQESGSTDLSTLRKFIPRAIRGAGEYIDVANEICRTSKYYDKIMKYNVGEFNGAREGLIEDFDELLSYIDVVSQKARTTSKPDFQKVRDEIEGAKKKIPEGDTGGDEDAMNADSGKKLVIGFDDLAGMRELLLDVSNKVLAKEVEIVGSYPPVFTEFILQKIEGTTDPELTVLGKNINNLIGEAKTYVANPKVASMDEGLEDMENFVERNLRTGTDMQNRFEQYVTRVIGHVLGCGSSSTTE